MNRFQNVSFSTVEEMLDYLPPDEKKLTEQLRQLVTGCLLTAKEKLAYNVPFYYGHSRICFIWPGSVPWGGIKEGVLVGFCKGHLLSDVRYLDLGSRKTVFTKTFYSVKEINTEMLRQLLYEAAWIDDEESKRKGRQKH